MAALDLSRNDFAEVRELSPAEQNRAFCANELDAIVYSVGHPNGLIRDATLTCHGMLVAVSGPAIDRMLSEYQEYERATIPGGTYPVNPAEVHTFGVRAVVVTTARMPDAVAYEITRAVFDNFDDFRRLHPAFEALSVAGMAHAAGRAPVHAVSSFRRLSVSDASTTSRWLKPSMGLAAFSAIMGPPMSICSMRNVSPPLEHLPQRPSCCRPLSGSARTVEKTVAGVPLAAAITAASHGSHHSGPDLLRQQRREAGGASPRCARVVLVRVKKTRDLLLQLRRLAPLSHGSGAVEKLLLEGSRQIIPLQERGRPKALQDTPFFL